MSATFNPGDKVLIDGTVRGTFIGVAASGKIIVDLGFGTSLADPERITPDEFAEYRSL